MTTNYHTAISVGAAANAATFNTPLGALDEAITNAQKGVYNVLEYGAVGDGSTDDTTAIQAAITAAASTGRTQNTVFLPSLRYKVTSPLIMSSGIRLTGDYAGTYIDAIHTGTSIVDMVGCTTSAIENITLNGDATTTPKTGILVGRDGSGGGAQNRFCRVRVTGEFSAAPIYSISAEDNYWENIQVTLSGGGALYGAYFSNADTLSVGGLTIGASAWDTHINGMQITNAVDSASAAALYLDVETYFQGFTCIGGYFITVNGAYIQLNVSGNTNGGISFINPVGECAAGGGSQPYGMNITGDYTLSGLVVLNANFTRATNAFVKAAPIILKHCLIHDSINGIGIDTIAPAARLELKGDSADNAIRQSDSYRAYEIGVGGHSVNGAFQLYDVAGTAARITVLYTGEVGIGDDAPTAKLDVTGNVNTTEVYKVDDTQVVGPRVVDARADDAINDSTWDSTTAGVLDALRDAMITHGLIAAA